MTWAIDRLGVYRLKGAYAYKNLLKENGWIADGSDFPVEDINPFLVFMQRWQGKISEETPRRISAG
jgi:predicted amidohydrolase YtcJ